MKLGRRPTSALLAALACLNILLRYPPTGHEVDVDSFFIHALSGAILSDGYAEWTISPLSYFGWYPLSYPSAGPFFLVSTSLLTGMTIEAAILIVTIALGPAGILGAFLMAREVTRTDAAALSAAMIYGLAPRFLAITLWTASTRNLFTILLPVVIWAMLRAYRTRSRAALLVLALSVVVLAATHRLVVLIVVVAIAFLAAIIVYLFLRLLRIRFPTIALHNSVRRASPHIALLTVVASVLVMLFATNVLDEYSRGEIASGSEPYIQLANMSISILRSVGLALPLSLVGLVIMTRQRNKTIVEPFLAITLVGLVPTFFLRQYTGFYILPFLALFGGLGCAGLIQSARRRPRVAAAVAVSLVVSVAAFSGYVLSIEIQRLPILTDETYTTGVYVNSLGAPGTMISNHGLTGIRIAAVSGVKVLPVGGAGTTFQNPELLAYGFYSADEVHARLVQVPITSLTVESDSIWIASGIQAELDWVLIMESPYGNIPSGLELRYTPSYYLELNSLPGVFLAYNNYYCSNLARSVYESAYRIYDNGYESIWWLYSPGITPYAPVFTNRCA